MALAKLCCYYFFVQTYAPKNKNKKDKKRETTMATTADNDNDNDTITARVAAPTTTGATPTTRKTYIYFGSGEVHQRDKGLQIVTVPATVTKIESRAFEGCDKLQKVECCKLKSQNTAQRTETNSSSTSSSSLLSSPSSLLRVIGDYAFCECHSLTTVVLPSSSVEVIGASAFFNCTHLTSVGSLRLPTTTPSLPSSSSSSSLSSMTLFTLPESLRVIEYNAFRGCSGLRGKINFPSSLVYVGPSSFMDCTSLRHVKFMTATSKPKKVLRRVDDGAFQGCTSLEVVELSKSIKFLGRECFFGCSKLSTVRFPSSSSSSSSSKNNNNINSLKKIEQSVFASCTSLEYIENIPSSIKSIGSIAFRNSGIKFINLSNNTSLQTIQYGTFSYCTSLTSIVLPYSIKDIENVAFFCCTNLKSVTFSTSSSSSSLDNSSDYGRRRRRRRRRRKQQQRPSQLKSIGDRAFADCTSLEDIPLRFSMIENVGFFAFANCPKLLSSSSSSSFLSLLSSELSSDGNKEQTNDDLLVPKNIKDIVHFICDLNRGGRRFLKRNDDDDDVDENVDTHDDDYDDSDYDCYVFDDDYDNGDDDEDDDEDSDDDDDEEDGDDDDDEDSDDDKMKYYPSLWPLILNRPLNEMNFFPSNEIFGGSNYDDYDDYENDVNNNNNNINNNTDGKTINYYTNTGPASRRASIVYYLILHGVAMEY